MGVPRLWLAAITVAHVGYCEMTQHTVLRAQPIRNTSGLYACVLTQGRDTCLPVGPRTPGTSRDACEASCHPAPPPPVPPPPPLPSTCGLKPGAPVTYKQLCSAAQNKTACDALSLTCKWVKRCSSTSSQARACRPYFPLVLAATDTAHGASGARTTDSWYELHL
jgi:hypothetical protein